MFKKKKVILSFDYELFFGEKSGTVLKALIVPTNKLLDVMDSVGAKGNFFVDWQMLKYLKESNTESALSDLNIVTDQLKNMVKRGHRIELHIHPHWVDAQYKCDGTWDFSNFCHYSLNSFTEAEIVDMFLEGTNLLTSIAREVNPDYKIVAFRAGGWAVQPFNKLKKGFEAADLKIDSSVAAGMYGKNQYSFYDFRDAPNENLYHFENIVCVKEEKGRFLEVPISTYNRNYMYKGIDYSFRHLGNSLDCITDGTHCRSDLKDEVFTGIRSLSLMSMSKLSPITVLLSYLLSNNDLITYIDHPKDFSKSVITSLKLISKLSKVLTYKELSNESLL